MGFSVVINSFGVLIDCHIRFGVMVSFHKRGTAPMPTTDFKHILVGKIPSTCYMMIQLDGRAIGFILWLKLNCFTFRRPIAIVEECDRIVAYSVTKILIPNFPKSLFKRWHQEITP